jgi:hypothetical protein
MPPTPRIHATSATLASFRLTTQVIRAMSYVPPGSPTYSYGASHQAGSIDSYIWADFQKNGITRPRPRPIGSSSAV